MTQFPMNNNTPNGQTHTIMESPIWIGRLYTFQPTFWVTWFVMFPIPFMFPLSWSTMHGFAQLFHSAIPLILAVFIDEKVIQSLIMPAWERSKQDDHIEIRGVSIPKIREWIMWHIHWRKTIILGSAALYSVLTIFSDDIDFVISMLFLEIALVVIFLLIKSWIGFKKFGFMSWYFSDVTSFISHNKSSS